MVSRIGIRFTAHVFQYVVLRQIWKLINAISSFWHDDVEKKEPAL